MPSQPLSRQAAHWRFTDFLNVLLFRYSCLFLPESSQYSSMGTHVRHWSAWSLFPSSFRTAVIIALTITTADTTAATTAATITIAPAVTTGADMW